MSATSTPFGLRPAYHPSGQARPEVFAITAATAGAIFKGGPIVIQADGSIARAADNAGRCDGTFMGCEYLDVNLRPVTSNFWPADTLATNVIAYVNLDNDVIFEIQANGSLTQADIGSHIGTTAVGLGSTMTGLSSGFALLSSLSNAVANQLQIVGLAPFVDNAWGDAFTIVRVKLAKQGFTAASAAF